MFANEGDEDYISPLPIFCLVVLIFSVVGLLFLKTLSREKPDPLGRSEERKTSTLSAATGKSSPTLVTPSQ